MIIKILKLLLCVYNLCLFVFSMSAENTSSLTRLIILCNAILLII